MKKWIKSKTLWINVLAIVTLILRAEYGYTLTPEIEIGILGLINIALRAITKEEIVWK